MAYRRYFIVHNLFTKASTVHSLWSAIFLVLQSGMHPIGKCKRLALAVVALFSNCFSRYYCTVPDLHQCIFCFAKQLSLAQAKLLTWDTILEVSSASSVFLDISLHNRIIAGQTIILDLNFLAGHGHFLSLTPNIQAFKMKPQLWLVFFFNLFQHYPIILFFVSAQYHSECLIR